MSQRYEYETVAQDRGGTIFEVELVPSTKLRPFARQHVQPTTEFHVISSEYIDTFVHLKPAEILRRLFVKYGPDSRQVNEFFRIHGNLEMCVMALILMASDDSIEGTMKISIFLETLSF